MHVLDNACDWIASQLLLCINAIAAGYLSSCIVIFLNIKLVDYTLQ